MKRSVKRHRKGVRSLALEAEQDEREHQRDHVEAAVDGVGDLALPVPFGRASPRDDRRIERRAREHRRSPQGPFHAVTL